MAWIIQIQDSEIAIVMLIAQDSIYVQWSLGDDRVKRPVTIISIGQHGLDDSDPGDKRAGRANSVGAQNQKSIQAHIFHSILTLYFIAFHCVSLYFILIR